MLPEKSRPPIVVPGAPPEPLRLGIAVGHGESVTRESGAYGLFFALLDSLPCSVDEISEPLCDDLLATLDALLVGAPGRQLEASEIRTVRRWTAAGGSLLLLSDVGGDAYPHGRSSLSLDLEGGMPRDGPGTNLHELAGDLSFGDMIVGSFPEDGDDVPEDGDDDPEDGDDIKLPFQPRLDLDVSCFLRRPATLSYESGVVMTLAHYRAKISRPNPLGACTVWPRGRKKWGLWSRRAWQVTHSLTPDADACTAEAIRRADGLAPATEEAMWGPSSRSFLFLRRSQGQGWISALGSSWWLRDDALGREDNAAFLQALVELWLPSLTEREMQRRWAGPQRHRLLQGYPMAPAMALVREDNGEAIDLDLDHQRPLIVGVLPHPFCNPRLTGCGFCPFPHESFSHSAARAVVDRVVAEIDATAGAEAELTRRPVDAVYIGGGTANLTPPDSFEKLCRKLAATFDLEQAEVTLEGVPIYFLTRDARLLATLQAALPARHHRISMGVQTFDPVQLERMGRSAFGSREQIAELVELAHTRGFTVSGDLLFNLPGQTLEQMRGDLRTAVEMGFDQICLYHLVMFEGMGTEWSKDAELLAELPANEQACCNWRLLRDELLDRDFVQITLTNFERADVHASNRHFTYEESGFRPETHDAVGFGPSAISSFTNIPRSWALKLLNPSSAEAYRDGIDRHGRCHERVFRYDRIDCEILYMTRKLALLGFDRRAYRRHFGADPLDRFPAELETAAKAGLLDLGDEHVALTPTGMFYADTVAGLLAWRRLAELQMKRLGQRADSTAPVVFHLRPFSAAHHGMG